MKNTAELAQRARVLMSVLKAMALVGGIGLTASLFDARNSRLVTIAFYLPTGLALLLLRGAIRRGHVVGAAWAVSLFFWVLLAFATLFFGGLQGLTAACFGVSCFLVGTVVSGRAAAWMAAASIAWCALIMGLELAGAMPTQLGPSYSPINSWAALTVSLVLMLVLLRNSLDSLRELHRQSEEAAAQRDEVLRRSIQAQKMELVGNLTSGIAHDFNNLLTVISGASRTLRDELTPAARAEVLADLDEATSRAAMMSRHLLSFGKAQVEELSVLDLSEQVNALAPMLPRLLGSRIAVDIDARVAAPVRASKVGLEQVLLNLVVNARDAMPEGGPLAVRVTCEDRTVCLIVKDGGVGMDETTRARIFAPFFTTKDSGTGLGLATVHAKVTQFGGEVLVDSAPGRGAQFVVRLPRVVSTGHG